MFDLTAVQKAIVAAELDGWLFFDFRGSNILARRILGMEAMPVGSRRFYYFVPAQGEPQKLVHRIESTALDHLPGRKNIYLRWQSLEESVAQMLQAARKIAMEYSARNANPYVSRVDAAVLELVRSCGVEVVSSGDLIQLFEATWDDEQIKSHFEAARHTRAAYDRAFGLIAHRVRQGQTVRESEVQQAILDFFQEQHLVTSHPPIVAKGPHAGDPHYETTPETDVRIGRDDFVLIDLWAKMDRPRSVYSDLTRVGYVGTSVPEEYRKIFAIVAQARDAAIDCVREAFAHKRPLPGWQVDEACRQVIDQAGYGEYFVHRTGHSIGQETHGNGANIDNLETHEERLLLPRTCFSIEPGIYFKEYGIRSEVNVFIDAQGGVHVTGGAPQTAPTAILANPNE